MVAIAQLVSAPDQALEPEGNESFQPPLHNGLSPSGKAQDLTPAFAGSNPASPARVSK